MPYLINGRSAVHKDSSGKVMTVDVCLTQVGNSVVPIPYMNVAESKDADKTAGSVTIDGNPACHQDSTFAKSRGDEPGGKKGVRSRKKGDYASFIMGSANVLIEGTPAVRAMELMVSNAKNTPPSPLLQSVGMPPLPASVTSPEALEELEGPFHNAVAHLMPEGLRTNNFVADLTAAEGRAIRQAAAPPATGQVYLDGIQEERSALALGIREAAPWPHKSDSHILIPLGECDHLPMEEPVEEAETQLAYFKLQRYLTPEHNPEYADNLRPGWLYVYVYGHLWRELEVMGDGTFKEVDLQTWQGPERVGFSESSFSIEQPGCIGTGANQQYVELPYRFSGEECEVQIAFSEVQWSWERVVSLGGMHPDDPRRKHRVQEGETLSHIALRYPWIENSRQLAELNSISESAALQIDQVLDIRPADEPPTDAAEKRLERMGPPVDLEAELDGHLLTLADPLGEAEILVNALTGLLATHQQVIGSLKGEHLKDTDADIDNQRVRGYFWYSRIPGEENEPGFPNLPETRKSGENWRRHCQVITETAQLAYPLLFDEDALSKMDEDVRDKFSSAAENMDKDAVEDWLQVRQRKAIREDFRKVRDLLVDVLWEKTESDIKLSAALADFALLPNPGYCELWMRFNDLVGKIIIDPCNADYAYDLPSVVERERSEDLFPGHDFLITLLNPDCDPVLQKWHDMLFPMESHVDLSCDTAPDFSSLADSEPFSVNFRPQDFAESMRLLGEEESSMTIVRTKARTIYKVIDRTLNLAKSLQERLPEGKTAELVLEPIFRLAKGSKLPVLENMRLVMPDQDMSGLVPAGVYRIQKMVDIEYQQRLDRNARTKAANVEADHYKGGRSKKLTTIRDTNGNVVGSQLISELSPYKGVPNPQIDRTDAKSLFATYGKTGGTEQLVRAKMKVLAFPETSYRRFVDRAEAFRGRVVDNKVYRSFPTAVLIFEVFNFNEALKRASQGGLGEAVAMTAGATIKLVAATIDAVEAWSGSTQFADSLKSSRYRILRSGAREIPLGKVTRIPVYKIFGIAAGVFDIIYTSNDSYVAFQKNDIDASIAYGVSALLGTGSLVLLTLNVIPVVGWILFVASVAAAFYAMWVSDDPLEYWATNGPFGSTPSNRLSQDDMSTAEQALNQLQNVLLKPAIKQIAKSPDHNQEGRDMWIVAELHLPAYDIDSSEISYRMDIVKFENLERNDGNNFHRGFGMPQPSRIEYLDINPSEQQHIAPDENNPHRIRAYYKVPFSDPYGYCECKIRVRHLMKGGLSLPLAGEGDSESGWAEDSEVIRRW